MTSQQKSMMRLGISHMLLVALLVLVLAPYLMVISASLRRGNFAPIGLLPGQVSLEHWKYVLGIPYQEVTNTPRANCAPSRLKHPRYSGAGTRLKFLPPLRSGSPFCPERLPMRFPDCTLDSDR